MRMIFRTSVMILAGCLMAPVVMSRVFADDDKPGDGDRPSKMEKNAVGTSAPKADEDLPPLNLLDAVKQGRVAVQAEGRSDGRVTVSVTNRTRKPLRVVLPPGIIAQNATGQMGGMMGGMGGGMGGMGGMGGGMGMMSVPPVDPQVPDEVASPFLQKKSN
jgi:hypothetical protein